MTELSLATTGSASVLLALAVAVYALVVGVVGANLGEGYLGIGVFARAEHPPHRAGPVSS